MKKIFIISLSVLTLSNIAFGQKLKVNDKAPAINIISVQGNSINIDNYEGKTILLTFFRYAGCPVCNVRMHDLIENYQKLQSQNIEVIAVFESSNETLTSYLKDSEIPFPLISDPDPLLYKKYKSRKSILKMMGTMFKKKPKQNMKKGDKLYKGKKYKRDGSITRIPADFIINNGVIKIAHYGKYIGDHIPLSEIQDFKSK